MGKVVKVGKVGKEGKEGRLLEYRLPTQVLQQSNKNGEKILLLWKFGKSLI